MLSLLHHNPVSVNWLYWTQVSAPRFGLVTPQTVYKWSGLIWNPLFITGLLRQNSHAIQFPHFKRTSQWYSVFRVCFVVQMVKNLPAMWETWVQSLGWEDPLEKGTAPHSSTLAWKIPWTEEPGRLQSMGLQSDTTERLHCFWLCFAAARACLVVTIQGYWRCGAWTSHGSGFPCCGAPALGARALTVVAHGLRSCGSGL